KSFLVEAEGLHVRGGVIMPPNASWGATNLQNIINLTNDGNIVLSRLSNLGVDRPAPYDNYVNRGTNMAATIFIRTANFENSGSLVANGGLLKVDTLTARMMGPTLTIFTNI